MNKKKISRETEDFIHARLILAQELLEESDRLEGIQAYKFCTEKLTHARHEREALVVYLLLTCFDRLGQTQGKHISFQNWLESKKEPYTSQKSVALKQLASNCLMWSLALFTRNTLPSMELGNPFYMVLIISTHITGRDCSIVSM